MGDAQRSGDGDATPPTDLEPSGGEIGGMKLEEFANGLSDPEESPPPSAVLSLDERLNATLGTPSPSARPRVMVRRQSDFEVPGFVPDQTSPEGDTTQPLQPSEPQRPRVVTLGRRASDSEVPGFAGGQAPVSTVKHAPAGPRVRTRRDSWVSPGALPGLQPGAELVPGFSSKQAGAGGGLEMVRKSAYARSRASAASSRASSRASLVTVDSDGASLPPPTPRRHRPRPASACS